MTAHSPGPWRWAANRDGEARLLAANDDMVVVGVCVSVASMTAGVEVYSTADARLIAAAPELLQALRALEAYGCAEHGREGGEACGQCEDLYTAYALIARIEGEP